VSLEIASDLTGVDGLLSLHTDPAPHPRRAVRTGRPSTGFNSGSDR